MLKEEKYYRRTYSLLNDLIAAYKKGFNTSTRKNIVEIKDVDKKKNQSRCIQMTVEKFDKFLSSEAFIPKNCFNNQKHHLK